MKIKKDKVSVILCSYNAQNFIVPTINSLLNQTYKNIEILILDNNSKDLTRQIIKKYEKIDSRIKAFFSNKNLGPYAGLNFLLKKVKGKYVAIADHDDIYHPQRIEYQVSFLKKHKKFVGCGTTAFIYFEKDNTFKYKKVKKISTFALHPSLLFIFNKNIKYDTNIKYKTDTFFMKYVLCKGKPLIFNVQKPLYLQRVRKDNKNLSIIWNKKLSFKNIIDYYHKSRDIKDLIKFSLKKILNYNLLMNIINFTNRKTIDNFKTNKFLREYLNYLE